MTSLIKSWRFGSTAWILFLFLQGLHLAPVNAQVTDTNYHRIVIAGEQYDKPAFHQLLWGKHYRKDWITPVNIPVINLDTVNGGLTAYEKGGGRQSKTLRLRNPQGKEWVLRSIDKSFGKALPEIAQGTFIETIINDQASIAEPYSALTIPMMAEAAGIYHTNPLIVFVPSQKALGEFNSEYGNDLYLLEQRPDENWEEAANFGNSKNIIGTDKLLENLREDNEKMVDQQMFVRARLFDMFIGDWGRHEDQWRWASFKGDDKTLYRPIPRDRDQAYTKLDGLLTGVAISAAAGHLEGFSNNIKDINTYNYPARNLDRRLMNMVTKDQWVSIASELQVVLSDKLIEESIHKLPPEVAPNYSTEIISTLKRRRARLVDWAEEYYQALAKEINLPGSEKSEYFLVQILSPEEILVQVYDLDKEGKTKTSPFFSRNYTSKETDEIRIYGLSGNDIFKIDSRPGNPIKVRIVGGPQKDKYIFNGPKGKVHLYDNADNEFPEQDIKKHISSDTSVHTYQYDSFKFNKKGFGISPSYNEEDRIHIALKYEIEKQQWRKEPFGYRHEFAARYSLSERAPSIGYSGIYKQLLGNWDLLLGVNYDWIRWNNYYGIGNETKNLVTDVNFNRVRSRQMDGWLGLSRRLGKYHTLSPGLFYQAIRILNDEDRFIAKQVPAFQEFDNKHFGGASLEYIYQNVDNIVLPTRGIRFNTDLRYTRNLKVDDSVVSHASSTLYIFLPITRSLVLRTKTGGATLWGKPEFYQLNKIGGGRWLRGFRRFRFYGESAFYNQVELQLIPNIKTYLFNGRAGLIAFYDVGRVWQPGENSSTWHSGYGGGIVISPFNKVAITVFKGWSKDETAFALRFNAGF